MASARLHSLPAIVAVTGSFAAALGVLAFSRRRRLAAQVGAVLDEEQELMMQAAELAEVPRQEGARSYGSNQ